MDRGLNRLSGRERQVADLIGRGLTNREVADALRISRRTAEWYVEQILAKLDLRSRSQLAVLVATSAGDNGHSSVRTMPEVGSAFFGREAELAELAQLLQPSRFVTLTGTGGVGKTRLAVELAKRSSSLFQDGAWFVDLARVANPIFVETQTASALRVTESASEPLNTSIVKRIGSRRLLLILDNCEHVIDAAAALAASITSSCPGATLLATSREPLRVAGEVAWRVDPLELPPGGQMQLDLSELASVASVALFVDRANHADRAFRLTSENVDAVIELCRRLAGIPLAVELAAARATTLTPGEMLARLTTASLLLTSGSRTAPPRQRTLKATVEWSYQLLTEEEAIFLRRLAVFVGGFTLEAAEQVAGGAPLQAPALELLSALVDKSLVGRMAEGRGQTRYRMHETVRQFAGERLIESGEVDLVQAAFVRHCLEATEGFSPSVYLDRPELLDALEAEMDNLREALKYAEASTGDEALRVAVAMYPYWSVRSGIAEGQSAFTRTLETDTADPSLRVWALALAAQLSHYAGKRESVRDFADEAILLGQSMPPSMGLSIALFWKGMWALQLDVEEVRSLLEESIAVGRKCGSIEFIHTYGMTGLSMVDMLTGRHDAAAERLTVSLSELDENRCVYLRCTVLALGGVVECVTGDIERGKEHVLAALRSARRWGFNYMGGWAVLAAAYLAASSGRYELCWQLYGAAHALRDDTYVTQTIVNRAEPILAPAKAAMDRESIEALVATGRALMPDRAFEIAISAIVADTSSSPAASWSARESAQPIL